MERIYNMPSINSLIGHFESSNLSHSLKPSVPRRKRTQTTYTNISNDCREELVKRVTENKEKIIEVAKDLNLNYSTAKSILRVYKSQKRVEKIPQKLRIKRKRRTQKVPRNFVSQTQFSSDVVAAAAMNMKSELQCSTSVSLGTPDNSKSIKLEAEDSDSNPKIKVEEADFNGLREYQQAEARAFLPYQQSIPLSQIFQTNHQCFANQTALQQRLLAIQKSKEAIAISQMKPSYHTGYFENPMNYITNERPAPLTDNSIFLLNKLMAERARRQNYNEIIQNRANMNTNNLFFGSNLPTSDYMRYYQAGANLF